MDPRDLALALTSDLAAGEVEPHPLDRIRMQKAVFLLVNRGSATWHDLYTFSPYDWGPYSRDLTSNIESMIAKDLVRVQPVPGRAYGRYETTESGEASAANVWVTLSPTEQSFLRRVRSYVTSRSFRDLLREVYAAYPDFATASRFSG